ncbi:MAG: T9SS type A sorting domain-containing protein [Bacteroidetes bacterium]|nr:T9SS type A sorting domain-containing protein [Bacteroidota bacterium]
MCRNECNLHSKPPSNGGTTAAYQWKLNGVNVGSNSLTYLNAGLQNGDTISCAISNTNACATNNNAISNTLTMVVNSTVTPSVSINASASSACQGTNITFTASPTNGGSTPTYQWKVNGNNVGTNATIYSNASLNNNDSVWCTILSNATCAITSPVSSNKTLLTITAPATPSISISASATTICTGSNVIFTATPTNGGASPTYQWKINGINAGTNSATFASSSLANGDIITCALTSNATCITTPNANSNAVAMTVNTTVLPTISINTGTNTICAGTNTTFTASITNGGASPAFQWKLNGVNVGTNSNSFSSSTLANGDIVTCILTSNAVCPSSNNIASNAITMTVNPSVSPSVSISTPTLTVCAASNVTFTASPTNGGTTPIYQWKINGTNVGTNSPTFSSTTLANGNIITCLMTSNATCASPVSILSNSITMTVTSPVVPTISITANKTTICAGNAISFSSTITNGGSSPTYQWKVNGINAGTNAPTFNTSTLLNSDVVTCVLTSNATCITSATANSNAINITVNSSVAPSVNISASSTTICSGTMVNFTTFPSNGGATPTYAWFNKGIQIGTGAVFSSSSLGNNDTIYAIITSSNTCASPATGESNKVVMTVNTSVSPTISIAASNASICPSEIVTFTATITNGGSNPIYQWQVNGFNAGSNSPTFVSSTLSNGDAVKCILTSNQICASPTALNSNTINISTNSLVVPTVSIAGSANNICPGQPVTFNATSANGGINPTYQWKINGLPVGTNSSSFASTTLNNSDIVSCEMTSSLGCASPKKAVSANIIMIVNTSIPATIGISPNKKNICSGDLVTYTASITNGGASPTYSWKVNGVNVGTNSATFATTNLNNNAIVNFTLFATSTCATAGILSNADTMIVRLKPALPVILALGDSLKSSVSGTSYTWFVNSTGAGSNKISIKPKTPGAYKVVVENNGCYSDSSVAYMYQPSLAIKSLEDIKIFAYPNPTADKVFIKLPSNNAYIAKVYDKNGRVVMEEQLVNDHGSAELNTDRIASGIYTIEVSSKTEKGVIRLSVIK